MSSLISVFNVAGSALTAQSQRLNVIASNLANADSRVSSTGQPYRARQVVFEVAPVAGGGAPGVNVRRVLEDPSPLRQEYDPGNPLADAGGYITLPNVDPVAEMVNMISASRAYQTNAELMNTAKGLMQKALSIGQN